MRTAVLLSADRECRSEPSYDCSRARATPAAARDRLSSRYLPGSGAEHALPYQVTPGLAVPATARSPPVHFSTCDAGVRGHPSRQGAPSRSYDRPAAASVTRVAGRVLAVAADSLAVAG